MENYLQILIEQAIGWLPRLGFAILILLVFWLLIKLVSRVISGVSSRLVSSGAGCKLGDVVCAGRQGGLVDAGLDHYIWHPGDGYHRAGGRPGPDRFCPGFCVEGQYFKYAGRGFDFALSPVPDW